MCRDFGGHLGWGDLRDREREDPGAQLRAAKILRGIWERAPQDIVAQFDLEDWAASRLARLPAELASLKLIDEQLRFARGDTIHLVYGTSDPKPAEVLIGLIPLLTWSSGERPAVKELRIEGLDATSAERFGAGMRQLYDEMSNIPQEGRIYNLTGGYKGVAVLLGVEACRLLAADSRVRAFYLYEKSRELIELQLGREGYLEPRPVSRVIRRAAS